MSGFVDDVMFSYHGGQWTGSPESSTMLYFEEVRQAAVPVECETTTVCGNGGEVCYLQVPRRGLVVQQIHSKSNQWSLSLWRFGVVKTSLH